MLSNISCWFGHEDLHMHGRIGWKMESFEPKMQGDPHAARKKGPHAPKEVSPLYRRHREKRVAIVHTPKN